MTQVTAKWKSLACSWPDSMRPGVSTAGGGATELAFEFPIIDRRSWEQLKDRRLALGRLGY